MLLALPTLLRATTAAAAATRPTFTRRVFLSLDLPRRPQRLACASTSTSSRKLTNSSSEPSTVNKGKTKATMPAKQKREPETPDEDEKVLDPKLASTPDVDDEEMSQPAKKKKKTTTTSSSTSSIGGKGKDWPDVKRNAFNPSPNKLPEKNTPLQQLRDALKKHGEAPKAEGNVVFWMRMRDMRIEDSRGLERASQLVQERKGSHLIVLYIISPQDYLAHDRSPRRIDFMLRSLEQIQSQLDELNIPFAVLTHEPRTGVPKKALELCKEWGVSNLIGNIEYEVDELWRDVQVVEQAKSYGVHAEFLDDTYVVPPGRVLTKDGRPYSVFSPWNRNWVDVLSKDPQLIESSEEPKANDKSVRSDSKLKGLFGTKIPESVKGFECKDRSYMEKLWPAGSKAAQKVLDNFVRGKGGLPILDAPATGEDLDKVQAASKESRLGRYGTGRNLMNENGASRLSPYLSAGLISARQCLRTTRDVTKGKLQVGRDSGPAMWNTEVSFRDFYGHVLAAWPRVCMGRAYVTRYEDVVWEYDDETLDKWQQGKTGYPIVDASMRQGAKQGYMHNRGRMVVRFISLFPVAARPNADICHRSFCRWPCS